MEREKMWVCCIIRVDMWSGISKRAKIDVANFIVRIFKNLVLCDLKRINLLGTEKIWVSLMIHENFTILSRLCHFFCWQFQFFHVASCIKFRADNRFSLRIYSYNNWQGTIKPLNFPSKSLEIENHWFGPLSPIELKISLHWRFLLCFENFLTCYPDQHVIAKKIEFFYPRRKTVQFFNLQTFKSKVLEDILLSQRTLMLLNMSLWQ